MPGPGDWTAWFGQPHYDGDPVFLGNFHLVAAPAAAVQPPPKVPPKAQPSPYAIPFKIVEKRGGGKADRPYPVLAPNEVLAGQQLTLLFDPPQQTGCSGRAECAPGRYEVHLGARKLDDAPGVWVEYWQTPFGAPAAVGGYPWSHSARPWETRVQLPPDLRPGFYALRLRAHYYPDGRPCEVYGQSLRLQYTRTDCSPMSFESTAELRVLDWPSPPALRAAGGAPIETDRPVHGIVSGLPPESEIDPKAELVGAKPKSYRVRIAIEPASGTAAAQASGGSAELRFTVPLADVWHTLAGSPSVPQHYSMEIRVRQEITPSLKPGQRRTPGYENWHEFVASFPLEIKPVCRHTVQPALSFVKPVVQVPEEEVELRVSGFPCGEVVRISHLDAAGRKVDWGESRVTDVAGSAGIARYRFDSSAWLVSTRNGYFPRPTTKPIQIEVIAEGASGSKARQTLTLRPKSYIEVPPTAKAGDWIEIRWVGLQPNAWAHVYLGEAPLTTGNGKALYAASPVIEVRLPDGVVGRQEIRVEDSAGNKASEFIEITGEGVAVVCKEPCIQLPDSAKQGEAFDAYVGGFRRNEQFTVRFAELFDVRSDYQRELQVKVPVLVPAGVRDGRYRVSVTSVSDPRRSAAREIEIRGGYRAPTLAVSCPRTQPGCELARFKPGESVHTSGFGWSIKGRFSAQLISERGSEPLPFERKGCRWGWVQGTPQGNPCDEAKGEINKFWKLPAPLAAGAYVIRVSDGVASAQAGFWVEAAAPEKKILRPTAQAIGPLGAARARAGDRVEIRGKGFAPQIRLSVRFDGSPARTAGALEADATGAIEKLFVQVPAEAKTGEHVIEISAAAQPSFPPASGARLAEIVVEPVRLALTVVERQATSPAPPEPKPAPPPGPVAKRCDPELPRPWQPGCVDAPAAGAKPEPVLNPPAAKPAPPAPPLAAPAPPSAPVVAPAPKPAVTQPPICEPNRPRYAQPGCVEPESAPKSGAGLPQKCNPNVPAYAQRGCVP